MSTSPPVQRPPVAGPGSGTPRRQVSGWLGFVRRYGWRAYALPLLVVVTVLALASRGLFPSSKQTAGAPKTSSAPTAGTPSVATSPALTNPASPAASSSTSSARSSSTRTRPRSTAPKRASSPSTSPVRVASTGGGEGLAADQLPPGAAYTSKGQGTFVTLPGSSPRFGTGPLRTFDIEVERGVAGADTQVFADTVVKTLMDKRSWTGDGAFSLQRVAKASDASFHISLTSPITLRTPCQYELKIETSCWHDSSGVSRVFLNLARWVRGDTQYGNDLSLYRLYMINHEVGHALGHVHTFTCLPHGLAPVMMQQTITLHEDQGRSAKVCRPNVWPFPPGIDPHVAVPT